MSSILVVCTGNVCRSPLAEGFLRASLRSRLGEEAPSVASAGTSGWEGSGAQPNSVAAAAELGLDVSAHRARALDPEEVGRATLVLAMAAEHRDEIAALAPETAGRTFTLKELVRLLASMPPEPADAAAEPAERRLSALVRRADAVRKREGSPAGEDVMDPLGRSFETYRGVARELKEWSDRLVDGLFGRRDVRVGAGGEA